MGILFARMLACYLRSRQVPTRVERLNREAGGDGPANNAQPSVSPEGEPRFVPPPRSRGIEEDERRIRRRNFCRKIINIIICRKIRKKFKEDVVSTLHAACQVEEIDARG